MPTRSASIALVLLVALSASVAAGCGSRRYGPSGPAAADARWRRRLEGVARRDLSCRAVRVVALNTSVFQADGCGALMEYEFLCAGRRCSWHRIEPAALRASRDFACPLSGLSAAVPAADRRDFAGCGRAASYSLICDRTHCQWQTYGMTGAAAPTGYGSASIAPPTTASVGVGADVSLANVVIPPPPGAEPPQPIVAVPTTAAPSPTPPPPASDGSTTGDLVIPPPPAP